MYLQLITNYVFLVYHTIACITFIYHIVIFQYIRTNTDYHLLKDLIKSGILNTKNNQSGNKPMLYQGLRRSSLITLHDLILSDYIYIFDFYVTQKPDP